MGRAAWRRTPCRVGARRQASALHRHRGCGVGHRWFVVSRNLAFADRGAHRTVARCAGLSAHLGHGAGALTDVSHVQHTQPKFGAAPLGDLVAGGCIVGEGAFVLRPDLWLAWSARHGRGGLRLGHFGGEPAHAAGRVVAAAHTRHLPTLWFVAVARKTQLAHHSAFFGFGHSRRFVDHGRGHLVHLDGFVHCALGGSGLGQPPNCRQFGRPVVHGAAGLGHRLQCPNRVLDWSRSSTQSAPRRWPWHWLGDRRGLDRRCAVVHGPRSGGPSLQHRCPSGASSQCLVGLGGALPLG